MTGQPTLAATLNRFFVAAASDLSRRKAIERMHGNEETAQDVELLINHLRPWAENGRGIPRDSARNLIPRLEAHLAELRAAVESE